ncbi:hypothetical protein T484DRAFT_1922451, partial [Baffinella frigidus]
TAARRHPRGGRGARGGRGGGGSGAVSSGVCAGPCGSAWGSSARSSARSSAGPKWRGCTSANGSNGTHGFSTTTRWPRGGCWRARTRGGPWGGV